MAVTQSRTANRHKIAVDHVKQSDTSAESDHDVPDNSYHRKKQMSASIFQYFVEADVSKQADMQVNVCLQLQKTWHCHIVQDPQLKLDDLDDALLYAQGDVLCIVKKYGQLFRSSVSLHNNRTVGITICRDYKYWAVYALHVEHV